MNEKEQLNQSEQEQTAVKETTEKKKFETIPVTVSNKLVGEPFAAKDGNEYRKVSIPNVDENDKSPWATFVVKADNIRENESGKSVTFDLPKDGSTKVMKEHAVKDENGKNVKDENGKNKYDREYKRIPNAEIKSACEAYKQNERKTELETIPVTVANKLVGEPFNAKDGNEYRKVSIPNVDENDKSPWATFVVKADNIRENESGKSVTFDLPKDGSTKVGKTIIGKDEKGENTYNTEYKRIPNAEIKSACEAYKQKERSHKQEKGTFSIKKTKNVERQVAEKPRELKDNEHSKNKGMDR